MASNTLSGAGVSPANTKAQLLHIGTGTLAAGAVVRLGDGTATLLTLSSVGFTVAGTLTVSGLTVVTGIQTLTGAGAVDPALPVTLFTSTAGAQALTLANGTHGQLKTIVHAVDGGSGILTATTSTGFSTITFTYVGDTATLQFFTGLGWVIVAVFAATVVA